MTSNPGGSPGLTDLKYYGVAVMDLLGQKQAIRQLGEIPLIEQNRPQLVQKLKESLGARLLFHDAVLPLVETLINHPPGAGLTSSSSQRQKVYWRIRSSQLKTWTFSDTVVAYAPLVNPTGDFAVRDLYSILVTCATTMLVLLSEGVPVRGAIEVGAALQPRDGEIYGPAFVEAYDLHETIAVYPRIVVGDKLWGHLRALLEYTGEDEVPSLIREIAKLCASLVNPDQDGVLFVDYLGTGFREIIGGAQYYKLFQKAHEFVVNEHESRIRLRDCKLAARYACLRQYFEARAPEWKETDEKT
jgi:hypothetical protein